MRFSPNGRKFLLASRHNRRVIPRQQDGAARCLVSSAGQFGFDDVGHHLQASELADGRESLRRTLVCLRPSGPVALELDRSRSQAGRGDLQSLGQLRANGRSQRSGPTLVTGVRERGEQGAISGRSDHRWRRCECARTKRLRFRLHGGAWQALCRTVVLCRLSTAKQKAQCGHSIQTHVSGASV
jgi:hypothetical protein